MKQEQQQQAERLYFQTDLNKTQIAETLGISRRSLHYWIRENNWERLKKNAAAMPSLISENCYHMMARLSEHVLSPGRSDEPVTRQEVDSMYKLAMTINKLKARITLNESMETFTTFLEGLQASAPALAEDIKPHISSYISSRASVSAAGITQEKTVANSKPASPSQNFMETQLDLEDMEAWASHPPSSAPSASPSALPTLSSALNDALRPLSPTPDNALRPVSPTLNNGSDIRKQLRGTATKGPGKAFYHKRHQPLAAA